MLVDVLKPFRFSRDGVTPIEAATGQPVDIPDLLLAGLEAEGFVLAHKIQPPLENKRTRGVVAPSDDLAALRARYEAVTGRLPDGRWGDARLRQELGDAS